MSVMEFSTKKTPVLILREQLQKVNCKHFHIFSKTGMEEETIPQDNLNYIYIHKNEPW